MKDLRVNASGDLILSGNDLQLVSGKELTAQKCRLVLSTNKGEWLLDPEEGINFKAILVKNPNKDAIIDAVRDGLRQIDETFEITEYTFEVIKRHLILTFKAKNDSGEEINLAVGDAQGIVNGQSVTLIVCAMNADEVLSAGDAISAMCVCNTDVEVIDCEC
jgi:hypothetical protein